MNYSMTQTNLANYKKYLLLEEKASNTVAKYLHDIEAFRSWLGQRPVSRERISEWKIELIKAGHAAVSVNGALAAVHSFLGFMGWEHFRVKYLKIQRRIFREASRELSQEEYMRLINTARAQGNTRLELLMETICATGIRVSEVQYITVEAVRRGRAEIALKGKVRTILIASKLARKLQKYARKQKIVCGEIFLTANGQSLSRRRIWGEMKNLCQAAAVDSSKVFPHNLRHLFACTFYKVYRDIVRLADVLGHSSIETTRIYLTTSGNEYAKQLDRLGLIS